MAEPRAFSLREVHEYAADPTTGVRRLVATHPYLRLRHTVAEPAVYLHEGRVWTETGELLDPPPKWVAGAIKTLTPAARAAAGFEPAPTDAA